MTSPNFLSHYFAYVCHVCKKPPSDDVKLKQCSRCKIISYCSREHQRCNWDQHKELCQYIHLKGGLDVILGEKEFRAADLRWYFIRLNAITDCEEALGRSLRMEERQTFLFPRVCEVCHTCGNSVVSCKECYCVGYCSKDHLEEDRNQHEKWCAWMKSSLDCINYRSLLPNTLLSPSKHGQGDFPEGMVAFLLGKEKARFSGPLDTPLALLSESLSFSLSLLYALLRTKLARGGSILEKENVTLHLVGAEVTVEGTQAVRWEEWFHYLPRLKHLCIVFVGPNVWSHDCEEKSKEIEVHGCNKCQQEGRMLKMQFFQFLYHEFLEKAEASGCFTTPDALAAFNSGVHMHGGPWRKSLPALLQFADTPLVLTAYTEDEMLGDLKRLQKVSIGEMQVLVGPLLNPFRGFRPVRDWDKENGKPVFFINQYIAIVCKLT